MTYYTKRIHMRIIAVFSAFTLTAAGLFWRLYAMALSDSLSKVAKNQQTYTLTVTEERGLIYDRKMVPLVGETERIVTAVFPSSSESLNKLINAADDEHRTGAVSLFAAGTPFTTETAYPVDADGLYSFKVKSRYSPTQTAAHLIGYTDHTGHGVSGLEKGYDDFLSENGRTIEVTGSVNALGRIIAGYEPEVRVTGDENAGLVLTIDKKIQQTVEDIGGKMLKKGAVVIMEPYTGEIMALASFPSYSPLSLASSVSDKDSSPMINRALLAYSVGSTFKLVTAAAALESSKKETYLTRKFTCTGLIDVSGRIFRCHDRTGHGELDIFDAVRGSCNPWFISLGLLLGGDAVLDMAKRFGFGEQLRLADGITSSAGVLPSSETLSSPAALANFAFGQGELTATPVQIARMTAAIVNGGKLISPTLILGRADAGGVLSAESKSVSVQAISPETAEQLKLLMAYSVMSDDSSGGKPSLTTAGGKTATAQTGRVGENGEELEEGWFTGFFPADKPVYVMTVLAENEGYGNKTAAPVFAAIADELTKLYG